MQNRRWIVVFSQEHDDGERKKLYDDVAAVGYSQAITFAGDRLVKEGEKREDWEVRRVDSIYAGS